MKHANRIAFLVVVMILSAASQATAQSASDQARLEMYRWRVELAREQVGSARKVAGEAREQLDNIEELLDESREKAERYFEERGKRKGLLSPSDGALERDKNQFEQQVADSQRGTTYTSLVDAKRVVAESHFTTAEALLAVYEACLAAAEGGDETALQVAVEAHTVISDAFTATMEKYLGIIKIECCPPQRHDPGQVGFNFAPSVDELMLAWTSAFLAALAAERAKAIVDILTEDVEEIPPELLEPLPTKFEAVA